MPATVIMDAQTSLKISERDVVTILYLDVFRVCGLEHVRTGNGEIQTAVGWIRIPLALPFHVCMTNISHIQHASDPRTKAELPTVSS